MELNITYSITRSKYIEKIKGKKCGKKLQKTKQKSVNFINQAWDTNFLN